ncbi:unnamed protein product [Periconia digitata]|uniref:SAP domain-containing protein n=1 Tax=Periconia digitata TaxID=1303443 RepID=A0A9W4XRR8_9PLEO|nr:unnamed protein product [Periconia digitata]
MRFPLNRSLYPYQLRSTHSTMAPGKTISSLLASSAPTVKGLQTLLQQIGCATSGRKDALHNRISQAVTSAPTMDPRKETKILSIDMGIKNLAYCIAKVTPSSEGEGQTRQPTATTMDILAWQRLDLTEEAWKHSNIADLPTSQTPDSAPTENATDQEDLFSPKNLSSTAFSLVRQLLKHDPDVILIERQRWRSASSSAIQQWTVRVNSLEAMLWATFTAIREMSSSTSSSSDTAAREGGKFTVYSVDPKRVGNYWLDSMMLDSSATESASPPKKKRTTKSDGRDSETSSPPSSTEIPLEKENTQIDSSTKKSVPRSKAEKKAKIHILRTWLGADIPSTIASPPPSSLEQSQHQQYHETYQTPLLLLPRPHIFFRFKGRTNTPPNPFSSSSSSSTTYDDDDPVLARDALLRSVTPSSTPTTPRPRKKRGEKDVSAEKQKRVVDKTEKKIDDITDCFLQAAAFVAWDQSLAGLRRRVEMGGFGSMEAGEKKKNGGKEGTKRGKKDGLSVR